MTRINVGCGQSPTPGWTNYDNSLSARMARVPAVLTLVERFGLLTNQQREFMRFARAHDIHFADAVAHIPEPDRSVTALYTSHMVEHLDRDDVQRFLREARRVLAPGGVLLANVWQSLDANHGPRAIDAELARLFPDDPPRFMETPYGYHDKDRIHADMADAGWESIRLDAVALRGRSPSATDFATGFVLGSPLTQQLTARGADMDAVTRALTGALIPVGGEQPFEPQHGAIVIVASL